MLVFTPYCCATADTDAPRAEAAATISRFSASGHDRCLRLTRPFVSIIKFVDTFGPHPCQKAGTLPQINPSWEAAFAGGILCFKWECCFSMIGFLHKSRER